MAFKLYSTDDGHMPAWEYHTIASGTKAEAGLALAFNNQGKLVASQTPTHICMFSNGGTALSADTVAPVVAIQPDQIWESINYYEVEIEVYPGKKVDLAENPLYVDANESTNGNFEITYIASNEMGDTIRGRFVK